eukprot:250636-Pyramimonas_sp.AAC.1
MVSGTLYFDISKFFENVSHAAMRAASRHYGFDERLLRTLCVLYRGPRRVRWPGATSRKVMPNGT